MSGPTLAGDGYRLVVQTDHGEIETDVVDMSDGRLCDLNFEAVFDNQEALAAEWQDYEHAICERPGCQPCGEAS